MSEPQKPTTTTTARAGSPATASTAPSASGDHAQASEGPAKRRRRRPRRKGAASPSDTGDADADGDESMVAVDAAASPADDEGKSAAAAAPASTPSGGAPIAHRPSKRRRRAKGGEGQEEEEDDDDDDDDDDGGGTAIAAANGTAARPRHQRKARRMSLAKSARDPRDEYPVAAKKPKLIAKTPNARGISPVIDFDGLSRPSLGTRERLEETPEQAAARMARLTGAVRTLLECVGEDPDREGLLATPSRYAKAMLFFTKGYQENVRDIVNNAIFHEGHDEMVICKDIEVFSLCEHHLVPFTGKMHIGYIPSDSVIGLSKLPRIAEMFSRRLQIQERLTREVATTVMEVLKPQGVAVVMESSHLCMVMRGVEKTGSSTITSCVLGCFEKKSKTRNEFMSLVGVNR